MSGARLPDAPDPGPHFLPPKALFWHRRDLRLDDNEGLYQAAQRGPVDGVFVFDTGILSALPKDDRRVSFIHSCVSELSELYARRGRRLWVLRGDPAALIPALAERLGVEAVFANRDYEPSAIERDERCAAALAKDGRELELFKDQVVFEGDEVLTSSKGRFRVFTPYKSAWLKHYELSPPPSRDSVKALGKGARLEASKRLLIPSLSDLGFEPGDSAKLGYADGISGGEAALEDFSDKIDQYHQERDLPAKPATSALGRHIRFGTLSIRKLARWAKSVGGSGAGVWLSELIWREFYSALLSEQPRLAQGESYISALDAIAWDNNPVLLEAWRQGKTGYPFVDAAMRQLMAMGWMHNRARMVAASFLCKDLLCDWRLGEAHFAQWLIDFDLASNNGGWQWSASTGCDAQPYFRIFNPILQSKRFDPAGSYIKRWVPELAQCPAAKIHDPWTMSPEQQAACGIVIGVDYPAPVVDRSLSRPIALARYKAALGK